MQKTVTAIAAGATIASSSSTFAAGGPQVEGARVRHGFARFDRHGNRLRITSGGKTIIDYSRFDVPVGTHVEFMQANSNSRILNRINSASPSAIMGSVSSNGRVYFINRAGVVFGKDAQIDVAGLFAAAGKMSNSDFLSGRDRVTGMQGQVRNDGAIRGAKEVVLAGRTVVNTGTIETGTGGLVAMVAGDTVTIRRSGRAIGVQVAGGAQALAQGGEGIRNSGVVRSQGGRVIATMGDLSSLAINLEGTVIAQAIEVDAGARGTVRLAGTLDASGASNGRAVGGAVHVTGRTVELDSTARVDASGPRRGGEVLVGGGYQGSDNRLRNAQWLSMAAGSTIRADATRAGNGGQVILWSDRLTSFRGDISVRGAGATGMGGFVETSGKQHLDFAGLADVRGGVDGLGGTLLLDPGFLIVQNTAGGVDTLGMAALNAQLALGNVIIQNSGVSQDSGIQWSATSTITGLNSSSLTLNSVGSGAGINIAAAPAFGSWSGDFIAQTQNGAITVGAAISRTAGNISLLAGGGQAVALNNATLSSTNGNVTVSGPATLGTNVTVTAGTGNVSFGGTVTGSGANRSLTVNSTGATSFGGSLSAIAALTTNAGGSTTFAGDVSLAGTSAINDAVTFTAGAHTVSNTGSSTTTFGSTVGGPGSLAISAGTGAITFTGAVGGDPLAGLSIASTGTVRFSSTLDGDMPLSINTTGATTFVGSVGSIAPLASIDIVTGSATFTGATTTTTGWQNYRNTLLAGNVTFASAGTTINGTLTRSGSGNRDVVFQSPGLVSVLGATTNVRHFTTDAGGGTVLGANVTLTGDLTLNDALTLSATSVTLGAVGISLQGITGGGNSLVLNGSGVTTLNALASGLLNVTSNSTGSFVLGADIEATGNIAITDATTVAGSGETRRIATSGVGTITLAALNGPASLEVQGGTGTITFGGAIGSTTALGGLTVTSDGNVGFSTTVNGGMDLDVATSGTTTFTGTVGATTALSSVAVHGLAAINSASIRTTGAQSYGRITLGSNTVVSSTGGGNLSVLGTIDGARTLALTTAGTTTLDGAVGGTTALTSLSATGPVVLNNGAVTTTGAQTYGALTLNADATLTSTAAGAVNLTGGANGAHALTIASTGTTTLGAAVGNGTALTSLAVTGPATINGGSVVTEGAQSYGNTTLGADTVLTSNDDAAITFTGTVNGARALQLATAGLTTFGGTVGATTALTSLTVLGDTAINGASVRTTGQQSYGAVQIGSTTTISTTASGDISFGGAITGVSGQNLTVNTAGATIFGSTVSGLGTLTTDSSGTNSLAGDVSTSGNIVLNGATTIGASSLAVASTGGAVTFGSTVNGASHLTVDAAGTTTFTGLVGGATALSSLDVSGAAAVNGGGITTVGAQSFGDVLLGANAAFTSTGGGALDFLGTINGGRTLALSTSGLTTLRGAVGGTTSLTSLTALGEVSIEGATVRTTGAQSYGAATLGDSTVLTSTSTGAITFASTVSGQGLHSLAINTAGVTTLGGDVSGLTGFTTDSAGSNVLAGSVHATGDIAINGAVSLTGSAQTVESTVGSVLFGSTINGGSALAVHAATGVTFAGSVGATTALASLTVDGAAAINGASVRTIGSQLYEDVALGANITLSTTGGGDITLGGTVGAATLRTLTINTAGVTTFGGEVTGLSTLTADIAGSNVIGADITTSGAIALNGATVLQGASRTITSTGSTVNFGGTLDGSSGGGGGGGSGGAGTALTVSAAGTTTLGGVVGGDVALQSLTIQNAAAITGASVRTTGDQTYGGAVTLNASTALTSTGGGAIGFASTINGAKALSVYTDGVTTFGGAIGATTALTSLEVTGDAAVNGGSVRTTGAQTYGNLALGASTTLASTSNGAILLGGTVVGTGLEAFAVNSGGVTTFGGDVSGVGSIATDSYGTNVVAANLSAANAIALAGATTLSGANVSIASSDATVSFGGTVNGATALSVSSASGTSFLGAVGAVTELESLDVTGATTITGGQVRTRGAQAYESMTLGANALLRSNEAGILVRGSINGARILDVQSAGWSSIEGSVGDTTALSAFVAGGPLRLLGGAVTTSGAQTYAQLELGANTTLRSTGGYGIMFGGAVNGAHALTVNTTGVTTFSGAVGASTALASIDVLNRATFAGASIVTQGSQGYGAVTLTGATSLASEGGGDIALRSTVNGAHALSVSTSGMTTFSGKVGGTTALASLSVSGPATIAASTITTSGAQSFGAVALGASTTLSSTGGGAIALGTVTGAGKSLAVNTSGATAFAGSVTGVSTLSVGGGGTTSIAGDISGSGNVSLLDEVMLLVGDHSVTSSAGNVLFGAALNGPGSLTASSGGTTRFASAVGASAALGSLVVDGASSFGGPSVRTSGNVQLNGAAVFTGSTAFSAGNAFVAGGTLNAGAWDLSISGNAISFADGISVSGRNVTLTGTTNGAGALALAATDTLSIYGALRTEGSLSLGSPSLLVLGGSIDSLGDLLFAGELQLDGSCTVTSRAGGDVIFQSAINGTSQFADSLTVNSSGLTAFDAAVGQSVGLRLLETNPPGTIREAPYANALLVIYGENHHPVPQESDGAADLAKTAASMLSPLIPSVSERPQPTKIHHNGNLESAIAGADAGAATPPVAEPTEEPARAEPVPVRAEPSPAR